MRILLVCCSLKNNTICDRGYCSYTFSLSWLLKVEITFAKKKLASIAKEETSFIICTALWV
jgi:hypothetical protein